MRVRLSAALFLASVCLTPLARAEPSDEELIASGVRLRREHRDAEALVAFQRAYAQTASPRALAQMALAEQALSSWVQAESNLKRALASTTDAWIVDHAALLNRALASIREHLATLSVVSTPGARLFLNGTEAGSLPLGALRVPAGSTTVTLRIAPDREVTHSLDLPAGAFVIDRVEVPGTRPAPRALPATPAAAVPSAVSPGSPVRGTEATTAPRQRTLAWCALGGAGVVLSAALTAEFVHQSQAARYNDDERCAYGELSRDQRCGVYRGRADATRVMATGGYIGAGVLAAASLLLFSISPDRTASVGTGVLRSRASRPWLALDRGETRWGWQGTW